MLRLGAHTALPLPQQAPRSRKPLASAFRLCATAAGDGEEEAQLQRHQRSLASLNPEQLAVVTADLRPLRVLAGPGSGKTRVLVTRVAHMILTQGVRPERILCVSFTNKAAQELQERLRHQIGDAANGITCGTFHNVCVRILRQHIGNMDCLQSSRFTIFDEEDAYHVMKDKWTELSASMEESQEVVVGDEEKAWDAGHVSRLLSNGKNSIAGSQSALRGAELWAKLVEEARIQYEENRYEPQFVEAVDNYQRALERFNALDFDDILHFCIRLLNVSPNTRAALLHKWPHLLVDEFQDTNLAQYELVKLLARPTSSGASVHKGRSVMVVGDLDQSIYGWRGGRVDIMRGRFMADFSDMAAHTLTLPSNYRSTPQILAAADACLTPSPQRSELRVRPMLPAGQRISLWRCDTAELEAEAVADRVSRLLSGAETGKPVPPQEICILYRINRLYILFERALLKRGIPYQVVNGIPLLQRTEVKDLLAYLRVVANPLDEVAFIRIINTPKRGIGDKAEEHIWEWAKKTYPGRPVSDCVLTEPEMPAELADLLTTAKARAGLSSLFSAYRSWVDDLPSLTVKDLLCRIVKDVAYAEHLEADLADLLETVSFCEKSSGDEDGDEEGRIRNVQTLVSMAATIGDPFQTGRDALITFMESLQLQTAVMEMRNPNAVWMGSMHAAKGLEFQHVFCVGLEDGVVPAHTSLKSAGKRLADVYEEERRLLYVGFTRAKERLYLTHSESRFNRGTEPSPFLFETHAALGDAAFELREAYLETPRQMRLATLNSWQPASERNSGSTRARGGGQRPPWELTPSTPGGNTRQFSTRASPVRGPGNQGKRSSAR